eukprot:8813801-Pyramimonas_sp.AAC.1
MEAPDSRALPQARSPAGLVCHRGGVRKAGHAGHGARRDDRSQLLPQALGAPQPYLGQPGGSSLACVA